MPTWPRGCSSISIAPFARAIWLEAARLQALVDPLRQTFTLHTFPAVIKEAMNMIGYPAGPCRKPVGAMPPETKKILAGAPETARRTLSS